MDERLYPIMLDVYNKLAIRGPECWGWRGLLNRGGYAVLMIPSLAARVGFTSMLAHRLSHLLFIGPIPHGAVVRHTCDNPSCSNPEHLLCGTVLDNAHDRISRGRSIYRPSAREKNGNAKLTSHQVEEIRAMYQKGHKSRPGCWTLRALAEKYGVGTTQISRIVRGESW